MKHQRMIPFANLIFRLIVFYHQAKLKMFVRRSPNYYVILVFILKS
jgi:hypothetical protein